LNLKGALSFRVGGRKPFPFFSFRKIFTAPVIHCLLFSAWPQSTPAAFQAGSPPLLTVVRNIHGGAPTSLTRSESMDVMDNAKIGFIGAGMMASAMIGGLVKKEVVPADAIIASDLYQPSLEKVSKETGIETTQDNLEVVGKSDIIVLAVKPDIVPRVLEQISPAIEPKHTVISIAAGITLYTLETALPAGARCVRVMPNTPCLVGAAAAAFALGAAAGEADCARAQALLRPVGLALEVQEKLLDAVTGLSGSGPAYAFLFIEALADGGVRAGLPRPVALQLAAQTVKGAAQMVLETGSHPGVLKDQVCSPGGTTITGVAALEREGFRNAAICAVVEATNRSKEMSKPADVDGSDSKRQRTK